MASVANSVMRVEGRQRSEVKLAAEYRRSAPMGVIVAVLGHLESAEGRRRLDQAEYESRNTEQWQTLKRA